MLEGLKSGLRTDESNMKDTALHSDQPFLEWHLGTFLAAEFPWKLLVYRTSSKKKQL